MGKREVTNVDDWKDLWDNWNVRIIVLSSLFLQSFLLFFGPLRKRTSKGYVITLLWTAYLLPPVISGYGFGLFNARLTSTILGYTKRGPLNQPPAYTHPNLLMFWSAFLLLHLSRPDTITAFSPEDNQLWLRRYLSIFVYIFYFCGVAGLSQHPRTTLFFAADFIYLIGIFRNISWVKSLCLSSMVGSIYLPKRLWLTTVEESDESDELSDLQVLKHAYRFFTHFKGLVVDFSFTFSKCSESRDLFIRLRPRDAFRVVERELNFFYEFIYTKAWIRRTPSSYIWRAGEFVGLWVAFMLFCITDKRKFRTGDIVVTYLLLGGSILLDASAMIMVLNSDWFIAYLRSRDGSLKQIETYLTFLKSWWPKIVHRRWSSSLPQYNLIKYCLRIGKEKSKYGASVPEILRTAIEEICYVDTLKFDEGMIDFIIMQLKTKSLLSDNPGTAWEIKSARGDWVLRDESCMHLLPRINEIDFDRSLLTWHIATDLCFYTDNGGDEEGERKRLRNMSKWLSDYMLLLMIFQPAMMSTVNALGKSMFRGICPEVKRFFQERNIRVIKGKSLEVLNEACETILSGYTEANAGAYVLMDARNLAEELKQLGEIRKWDVLSKVWVEMLCYSASRCKGSAHMKQIAQGGQLLTFVWLLMVHFGLVN